MDELVTTEWLAAELGAADLIVLDATYHALDPARDAAAEFAAAHIPEARHLDLKTLADQADPLPSMLPSAQDFAERMAALGVERGSRVVLYDRSPHRTSARAWWVMRHFDLRDVALLDGGLATWLAEGRPVQAGAGVAREGAPAVVAGDPALVRSKAQMLELLESGAAQIVDARSPSRFSGEEGDPRPGVAPGHIPGSRNLRYDRLFAADGRWLRGDALRAAFAQAGVDLDRPLAMTCGSGITAAVLAFGAHLLGKRDVSLYDGSWSEWGADPATPKALRPA